eukprot:gnl/TRDRNA2_/TRDRNA2_169321_c1_seq2.p1 gnl/TRDRNA2_/TRDRNA2_169321_c1~~gnl/TRDRNA2_/TRDRNA2_169321_c1_seq2.p1  ORF type:complete len:316 (-),score=7.09 gnl/TRDRNA2_/TRDRNA2_169321_c1_seq2:147-1094(-)
MCRYKICMNNCMCLPLCIALALPLAGLGLRVGAKTVQTDISAASEANAYNNNSNSTTTSLQTTTTPTTTTTTFWNARPCSASGLSHSWAKYISARQLQNSSQILKSYSQDAIINHATFSSAVIDVYDGLAGVRDFYMQAFLPVSQGGLPVSQVEVVHDYPDPGWSGNGRACGRHFRIWRSNASNVDLAAETFIFDTNGFIIHHNIVLQCTTDGKPCLIARDPGSVLTTLRSLLPVRLADSIYSFRLFPVVRHAILFAMDMVPSTALLWRSSNWLMKLDYSPSAALLVMTTLHKHLPSTGRQRAHRVVSSACLHSS